MEYSSVLAVLKSDPAFTALAAIMITTFAVGLRALDRWIGEDGFLAFLGIVLMAQAAFYFYAILPYTLVDDQLNALILGYLGGVPH